MLPYITQIYIPSGDNADELLRQNRVFEDERWTRNRSVTSFDINSKYPELILVSYNNNEEAPNEPEGVVLIWNKKFSKTSPEYIFHCQVYITCWVYRQV